MITKSLIIAALIFGVILLIGILLVTLTYNYILADWLLALGSSGLLLSLCSLAVIRGVFTGF